VSVSAQAALVAILADASPGRVRLLVLALLVAKVLGWDLASCFLLLAAIPASITMQRGKKGIVTY